MSQGYFTFPPQFSSSVIGVGPLDGGTPSITGASIAGGLLYLQSASATMPGLVNLTADQFLGTGNKVFSSTVTLGDTLANTQTAQNISITGIGINVLDASVSGGLGNGTYTLGILNQITSTAQAAGQFRGALRALVKIIPVTQTTFGGQYNGFQMTATNNNGIINGTGLLRGGIFSCSTFGGCSSILQVGISVLSGIFTTGIVTTSIGGDFSGSAAVGTEALTHLAVGIRIGSTSVTASGSSVSNTAMGVRIATVAATGTLPVAIGLQIDNLITGTVAYAVKSDSVAQSVFQGPMIFQGGSNASPASNGAGTAGQWAWDASFIYICVATNTWRRVASTGSY